VLPLHHEAIGKNPGKLRYSSLEIFQAKAVVKFWGNGRLGDATLPVRTRTPNPELRTPNPNWMKSGSVSYSFKQYEQEWQISHRPGRSFGI
jgi:hypothetical protein